MLTVERKVGDESTTFTLTPIEAAFLRSMVNKEMPLPEMSFSDMGSAYVDGTRDGWFEGYHTAIATLILGTLSFAVFYRIWRDAS